MHRIGPTRLDLAREFRTQSFRSPQPGSAEAAQAHAMSFGRQPCDFAPTPPRGEFRRDQVGSATISARWSTQGSSPGRRLISRGSRVRIPGASASAALRRGEIDWWENPPRDLVDQVSGDRNITVDSHFATANGIMTFNHRYPPFDNPAIRRALVGAVDQAEAMSAIAGSDRNN
jgi:hypothetical protein